MMLLLIFGIAYDIKVRGLQGMNTQAEAGTKDVQELARFIVDQEVPAIFVETSISERHLIAVQKAVGISRCYGDYWRCVILGCHGLTWHRNRYV